MIYASIFPHLIVWVSWYQNRKRSYGAQHLCWRVTAYCSICRTTGPLTSGSQTRWELTRGLPSRKNTAQPGSRNGAVCRNIELATPDNS